MTRDVDYTWRLAELMASRGWHNSTDLTPHLRERGIDLSASQVYRLVTQRPERVSLKMVSALCDIFACGPELLITTTAADARRKKTATGPTNVTDLNKSIRPKRARVIADDN
ncbi:helix-turn-helix transcriptional regulator (plasmid) [Rhodococcus sp. ZPP]|uniref:helix-turn-helix domain-containing protein n=1 Tax=Rhodococcus TaxID=1827 RepID=UPI001AD87FFD|nr:MULTISPECIES: helix-turn-helix transcriptional regulator [Rhodococcus]MBO8150753.1 helix-turn-helix transcriptional regulator [Rhodococcus erythropolis]QTJ70929.1 helix-turn-helix transcriptional regulator [Rhodococcus sp. ZPP]